jgi:hypothetical protein
VGTGAWEVDHVAISPMVELELAYLREIGRLRRAPADVLSALSSALGMTVSASRFPLWSAMRWRCLGLVTRSTA